MESKKENGDMFLIDYIPRIYAFAGETKKGIWQSF